MKLLRGHEISKGKAATLLDLSRHELFDLMSFSRVPVIDLTEKELKEELSLPWPADK